MIALAGRVRLVVAATSVLGIAAFCWPLLIPASPAAQAHPHDAPLVVLFLLPLFYLITLDFIQRYSAIFFLPILLIKPIWLQ
jgi:energy-coupling factor transport system substrate-specific component